MGKRRTGLHPLAYMGVEPSSPPLLVRKPQDPNSNNNENFNIGTIWINNTTDKIWMLTNLDSGVATWTPIEDTAITVNADVGSAVEVDDELNLLGDGIITTFASGNTINVSISDAAGMDGQLIIAATGAPPLWANLASSGGSVTITNTANGINLEAAGVAALTSLAGDTGAAVPLAGVITVAGGSNITTVGAVNTLTINLDNSPSVSGSLTAGTTVSAGTSIDSGTTMTCGTGLTVSAGGIDSTGTTQLQDLTRGVVFSDATGVLSIDGAGSAGTDGQVIIGATGSDPIWANITSVGGTVTITEGANTINLENALTDLPWTVTSTTPVQMVVNNGYISFFVGEASFNLPATAVVGDRLRITTGGHALSGQVKITQNALQWIGNGNVDSTTGVTGWISTRGAVEIICTVTDVGFRMISENGALVSFH